MGYTNRDKRYVTVTAKEKRGVRVKRRRAEKREVRGQHLRSAVQATKRGWWYA